MKKLNLTQKRKEILQSLNINSPFNLLRYYPYKYEHLELAKLSMKLHDKKITIQGSIFGKVKVDYFSKNKCRVMLEIIYNDDLVKIIMFNRFGWSKVLTEGMHLVVTGKYNAFKNEIVASSFFVGKMEESEKYVPTYSLPSNVKEQTFEKFMQACYESFEDEIYDIIPEYFINKYRLTSLKNSLKWIHFPENGEQLHQANRYLKYEEFLAFCTMGAIKRRSFHENSNKSHKDIRYDKLNEIIKSLPFKLSDDQFMVLKEILKDINSDYCMNRLLQGDVGSGKTIVALLALVANSFAYYQGALMVPTDILAKQHFNEFKKNLKNFNINIYLLVSDMDKKEKDYTIEQIRNNLNCIVIGTHSLIQENIIFRKLGLAVIDEQHRFGVKQRLSLKEKGSMIDVLYMSATPIPRTLASTLYLDMDVSTISHFPHSGRKINTKFIRSNDIKIIKKDIVSYLSDSHNKLYIVCPSIDDSALDISNVLHIHEQIKKEFPQYESLCLHGKLKNDEKADIMEKFANGTASILISTTVIEVGINVKNADMMIIMNSERFGLAQIHQLRGRIGRYGNVGYCYLLTDNQDEDVIERLTFISNNDDGFKISEFDLKRRGPGDMLGLKQSGISPFTIANLIDDYVVLQAASRDANYMISNSEKFSYYLNIIKRKIEESQKYID